MVYTEEQLRERKKRALAEVTSVLSIPDADAVRVLRLFKWYVLCCAGDSAARPGACHRNARQRHPSLLSRWHATYA